MNAPNMANSFNVGSHLGLDLGHDVKDLQLDLRLDLRHAPKDLRVA